MQGFETIARIREQIARLLTGEAGYRSTPPNPLCDRYIPRGRFRAVEVIPEKLGPQSGATPRYPFLVLSTGYLGDVDSPTDATGGSYLYGRYGMQITVGYGQRPQREGELDDEITCDVLRIRDVLTAEQNWGLTDDLGATWTDGAWTGCLVTGSDLEEAGEGDPPPVRLSIITLEIDFRQRRGPYD
jgi:hypothetical protein